MQKYERGRVLGKGSFGRAVLARNRDNDTFVVIKEVSMRNMKSSERQAAKQEAELLMRLNHPNIVRCHESFIDGATLCIVMDYCPGGDLHKTLQQRRGQYIPEARLLDYFVQICLAIKHLHDRKILHRDVKTQNVFISSQGFLKVGDLGVSKVLDSTTALAATGVGTPYYLSPEICHGRKYNFKTDVWSAGCVLYELACLKRPFEGGDMRGLINKIIHGSYAQPPPHYSLELRNLIDSMLRREPSQRLSINQVLRKPILQARIRNFLSESGQEYFAMGKGIPGPIFQARPLSKPGHETEQQQAAAGLAREQVVVPSPGPLQQLDQVPAQAPRQSAPKHMKRHQVQAERFYKAEERRQKLRDEQRQQQCDAAMHMRHEFARRQQEALRNKAAAEAQISNIAIYTPSRPPPEYLSRLPQQQHGQHSDGIVAAGPADGLEPRYLGNAVEGGQECAREPRERGVGRASGRHMGHRVRAGVIHPSPLHPDKVSGIGELSPEQRRAVYLENRRAAERNRQALVHAGGCGALAAFLGVPDDVHAAPAVPVTPSAPPPSDTSAFWASAAIQGPAEALPEPTTAEDAVCVEGRAVWDFVRHRLMETNQMTVSDQQDASSMHEGARHRVQMMDVAKLQCTSSGKGGDAAGWCDERASRYDSPQQRITCERDGVAAGPEICARNPADHKLLMQQPSDNAGDGTGAEIDGGNEVGACKVPWPEMAEIVVGKWEVAGVGERRGGAGGGLNWGSAAEPTVERMYEGEVTVGTGILMQGEEDEDSGGGPKMQDDKGYEAMMEDMMDALQSRESSVDEERKSGSESATCKEQDIVLAAGSVYERLSAGSFLMDGAKVQLPVEVTATLPQKVEALRVLLEEALGAETFQAIYRHMEQLHNGEDAAGNVDTLRNLVGMGRECYLQLVHQLIMSEEVMHTEVQSK